MSCWDAVRCCFVIANTLHTAEIKRDKGHKSFETMSKAEQSQKNLSLTHTHTHPMLHAYTCKNTSLAYIWICVQLPCYKPQNWNSPTVAVLTHLMHPPTCPWRSQESPLQKWLCKQNALLDLRCVLVGALYDSSVVLISSLVLTSGLLSSDPWLVHWLWL